MPAGYPLGFRDDLVAVARKGEIPVAQVARDFRDHRMGVCAVGWPRTTLRPGSVLASRRPRTRKLKKVKRRVGELEMENEVLRRAAACLSQANLKLGQSSK